MSHSLPFADAIIVRYNHRPRHVSRHRHVRVVFGLASLFLITLFGPVVPASAQWSEGGLILSDLPGETEGWVLVPDEQEGFWAVYTMYAGGTNERTFVQRYDRHGNTLFDGPGIRVFDPDQYYADGHLMWAWRNNDSTLTVAINAWHVDGKWTIRGQRFDLAGQRLWGPSGAQASDTSGAYYRVSFYHPGASQVNVSPTPDGGFYAAYHRTGWEELWVCGVTGQGQKRWPEGEDKYYVTIESYPRLQSDHLGGVHILYKRPAPNDHRIWYDHIYLGGQHTPYNWKAVWFPDESNNISGFGLGLFSAFHPRGYGLIFSSNALMQLLDYEGGILWDSSGVPHPDFRVDGTTYELRTPPLVFPDSSIVVAMRTSPGFKLFRMSALGTIVTTDTIPENPLPGHFYTTSYDIAKSDTDTSFYLVAEANAHPSTRVVFAKKLNADFESLFPTDTVRVYEDLNLLAFKTVATSDGELLMGAIHNYNRDVYMWRISADGQVYGRDLDVPRPSEETAPQPLQADITAAWPNPFNQSVRLQMEIPRSGSYELVIVNLLGQVVERRRFAWPAGVQEWSWQPDASLATGVYLARFGELGGSGVVVRKLVMMK